MAEFTVRLEPGEERVIETAGTLAKRSERPNSRFRGVDARSLAEARDRQLEFWRRNQAQGLEVELPDEEIQRACVEDPRWFEILRSIMRHATATYTWPEAIHPISGGGCMGDGDHGWSAAEFVNLVHDMLVKEQNEAIVAGFGLPSRWLAGVSPPLRVAEPSARAFRQ